MTLIMTGAAERDADPGLYAEVLLEQLPEQLDAYLDDWILTDDYPNMMFRYFPGIDRPWLQRVFFIVKKAIEEEDEPTTDAPDDVARTRADQLSLVGDKRSADEGGPGNVSPDDSGNAATGERKPDKP
jgi:hypothetical protein